MSYYQLGLKTVRVFFFFRIIIASYLFSQEPKKTMSTQVRSNL